MSKLWVKNEQMTFSYWEKTDANWTSKIINHFKDTNLPHFKTSTSIWGRKWGLLANAL